ncbi:aggregation-promoting factor [Pediococcus pentosaceus]|jgi:LysM repeat protein|uniref:LysM peptidoglycan-binding domain-containing protein n=1 Tax=Pediococcus pentosaceus TaxID=1255 RepID=A0A6L5A0N8_PEDPE|nr:LysM domain-containing protein [Pediococcus pentosaceus]KAF0350378.1 LysM peptidoglycan-binding domain-containing protein [Pediococcus pentosaceus]KAF0412948.1 LysM peptidoglycan-binding domain-containing protein [Pediococcus pentosaceus]KAF0502110.1 LysM peptidoglycan-binding domain-containing protein [Pediococcus pentosaceus]MBF7106856.1 LysM peptidoglycan-binding domain-containing protein [Pediococcus pentosaceus]MBF7109475.1 LysM peptidoglycan-binding domain-containing protein [Pediococ
MSIKAKLSKLSIALLSGAALGAAMITTTSSSANADEIYTVKSGDTLSEISYAFGLNGDYNSLAKANNIKDANIIEVGQKLVITNSGDIKKATKSEVNTLPEVAKNANAANTTTANTTASTTTNKTNTTTVAKTNTVATSTPATTTTTSTVSGGEASAKAWIANKESGGSYSATNGQYVGKYQLSSSYLNGDYSAANQERVADNYVKSRYGSWSAAKSAWLSQGWY